VLSFSSPVSERVPWVSGTTGDDPGTLGGGRDDAAGQRWPLGRPLQSGAHAEPAASINSNGTDRRAPPSAEAASLFHLVGTSLAMDWW
jgi:hypothetical protein